MKYKIKKIGKYWYIKKNPLFIFTKSIKQRFKSEARAKYHLKKMVK